MIINNTQKDGNSALHYVCESWDPSICVISKVDRLGARNC